jgi:hypothetical protein
VKTRTTRCASEIKSSQATSGAFVCGVDGRPCEVAEAIRSPLSAVGDADALIGEVKNLLPCEHCRRTERDASRLAGVRRRKVAPDRGAAIDMILDAIGEVQSGEPERP